MQARISRGYAALARLERQCYHSHFQDPRTKSLLFDSLVRPAGMYGSPCWGADLLDREWARVERLQILMFARMIRSKPSVPHQIILAEFGASPYNSMRPSRLSPTYTESEISAPLLTVASAYLG